MDLNKSSRRDQIQMMNLRKWFDKHPKHAGKKDILSSKRQQFQWQCQDCNLILSSELQAREHFSGKKHQNAIKKKASWNIYSEISVNLTGNITRLENKLLPKRTFLGSYSSEPCSFNNHLQPNSYLRDIFPPPAGKDNILETVIKSEKRNLPPGDLSIYRTPSGKYYCQSCNVTVNSQGQFIQHSESKKHKHKLSRGCKLG